LIIAMEEDLNNFKRNEVWELVPRPKKNVIGTKWVFRNNKMDLVLSQRTRQGLLAKDILKLKAWTMERLIHR
jgi:hypothetical protein